jgi:sec-independent protein translocase protein TatC
MSADKQLSILGHIAELRNRLVKSVIAVIITTAISFIFAKWLFYFLTLPVKGYPLIYVEVTEMISIYMRVCLVAGVILAMPYLVYQFFGFVAPALTSKEKRYIYIVVPWVSFMFIAGVVFAYFILIPPAMRFLFTFGNDIATPQVRIGNYINVMTRLLLAVGLVFEMPVVSTFLARMGIITHKWLAGRRKWAVILSFVMAAIITPTVDPINESIVAVPLIALYELSIWLAWAFQKRRQATAIAAESSVAS